MSPRALPSPPAPVVVDRPPPGAFAPGPDARRIGREAIRALHAELALSPKPGLVSPLDSGAHRDMTIATFLRSLFALRVYFPRVAEAGAAGAPFAALRDLGLEAERRMAAATGGVNTHRGAIFSLGLLAASAGRLAARDEPLSPAAICAGVARAWGADIEAARPAAAAVSNGLRALARHGGPGAREAAAQGYPILTAVALPALDAALEAGACREAARVQALFALMAALNDTNLLHRGGAAGLAFVQERARAFLAAGGVLSPGWRGRALALHRACVARDLSPGGAADLLAAAIFLHDLRDAS